LLSIASRICYKRRAAIQPIKDIPMEQSLIMEDALQPQDAQQSRRSNRFALAIAASLLLHGVCSIVVIGLPAGSSQPSVTYLDLSMAPQAAAPPMAAPAPHPKAQPAPLAEKPAPAEKAEIPEPARQAEQPKAVPDQPTAAPEVKRADEQLAHTTLGLGLTRGFFKSLGEGETLRDDVKEYYLGMLQGINEKWWMDKELQKEGARPIIIALTIARNGAIVGCDILRSSGSVRYDKAVLAALNSAGPLPPLPPSYDMEFFQAPIRLVPPLNLMRW
jgi:periplasmic protein TonB